MTQWQPIETAPDVGTDDLLVSDGIYVALAWRSDREGWIDSTDPQEYPLSPQPTHWAPLPEPPSA